MCAGLLDRQGFFFVMVTGLFLAIQYGLTRRLGDLLAAVGIAVALLVIYDEVLAPRVIYSVNGYWPDPLLPLHALDPGVVFWHLGKYRDGLNLMLSNVAVMFGGFRTPALPLVFLAAAMGPRDLREQVRRNTRGVALACLGLAAQVMMFGLMVHQHPAINTLMDERYWYHPLPFLGTVVFAVAVWLNDALPGMSVKRRRLVSVGLAATIVLNLAGLSLGMDIMRIGTDFGPAISQTELLKSSIQAGVPDDRLDERSVGFFQHDRNLRQRIRQ
jgi:hypothetical protein